MISMRHESGLMSSPDRPLPAPPPGCQLCRVTGEGGDEPCDARREDGLVSSILHLGAHGHPGHRPGVVVKYPSRRMTSPRVAVVNAPRDQTAQGWGPAGPLFFCDSLRASFTPPLEAGVPVILPVAFVLAPIQPGLSSE